MGQLQAALWLGLANLDHVRNEQRAGFTELNALDKRERTAAFGISHDLRAGTAEKLFSWHTAAITRIIASHLTAVRVEVSKRYLMWKHKYQHSGVLASIRHVRACNHVGCELNALSTIAQRM